MTPIEHPRISARRRAVSADHLADMDHTFIERLRSLSRLAKTIGAERDVTVIHDLGTALEDLINQLRRLPADSEMGFAVRQSIGETLRLYRANLQIVLDRYHAQP